MTQGASYPEKPSLYMPLPRLTMSAPLSFWSKTAKVSSIWAWKLKLPTIDGNTAQNQKTSQKRATAIDDERGHRHPRWGEGMPSPHPVSLHSLPPSFSSSSRMKKKLRRAQAWRH